ncbi:hypothetical protein [Halanaerobaculum tunisiense]
MEVTGSSWLEIDLDAIKYNLEQVRDKLDMTTHYNLIQQKFYTRANVIY